MPVTAAIYAVSSADMNAQLDDALADRIAIAEVACLSLPQTDANAGLGDLISYGVQPFSEWFVPVFALISEEFDHMIYCSLKATPGLLLRGLARQFSLSCVKYTA